MFELKPDFEEVLERYEAWWECEIIDRPLVSITFGKPADERTPYPPPKHYATLKDRWFDTERIVESHVARLNNTVFYADSLPIAYPNLGPEVFSAFYGCPLVFGETTSWSEPILKDWSDESLAELKIDLDNVYFKKIMEITDALLDVGKGRFIVGYTDFHPGGDAIAAFRDPQMLCIDLIEHPDKVKALVKRVTDDFLMVYDIFYDKLSAAGMPSTTWLGATCKGKYHVPSNDFSCMISDDMFKSVFLDGIIRECRHMDRCIYHLDGPGALRYLDTLLAIPEIHAIQWVPGAGQSHWMRWIDVYRRIQAAGKAFCLGVNINELDQLFEVLKPEGAWVSVAGIGDQETADAVLKRMARWGT